MARHPMSSADAAWLRMDQPTNLMVINSVLWFDEPVDVDRVRARWRERVLDVFPVFTRRPVEGPAGRAPAWVDHEAFDEDLHFHRRALPSPGDQGALAEVIGDLVTVPMDRSRPLWDVHVFEGPGEGGALLVRMHHCIADGVALARVMLSLTDGGEDHRGFAAPPSPGLAATAASVAGTLAHESLETLLHPERLAGLVRAAAPDVRTLVKLLAPVAERPTSLKGELHAARRVAWTDGLALRTVKATGRAFGVTVNDVLVSAVAGALRRRLVAGGEDPGELHAMVPFNLRPLDAPLPRELGNRFGLVLLSLPVEVADPVERLRVVHERMGEIKTSHEGAMSYGILGLVGRTPGPVEDLLIPFFSAKATMVLTNVPGPRKGVSLAGAPVRGVLVWAPCSGSLGMSVAIFSYAGRVTVGFLADAGLLPDPAAMAADVEREVRLLRRRASAAAARGSAG
jgi:WS/DGAT/MGAT family acyltransferase